MKTITDTNGKEFEIVESQPTKKVAGGEVTIHLVREVLTAGPRSWNVIAEQSRADGLATKRRLDFSSEQAARDKFDSYK